MGWRFHPQTVTGFVSVPATVHVESIGNRLIQRPIQFSLHIRALATTAITVGTAFCLLRELEPGFMNLEWQSRLRRRWFFPFDGQGAGQILKYNAAITGGTTVYGCLDTT